MSSSCSSNGLLPSSASPRDQDDLEARPTNEFEHDGQTMLKISDPQNQVTVRELVTPSTIELPALVLIQPSMPQLLGVEVLMVGGRRSY